MSLLLLLQKSDLIKEGLSSEAPVQQIEWFELAQKGGYPMIILLVLSLITVYVTVERISTLKRAKRKPEVLLNQVKEMVLKSNLKSAQALCDQSKTPMARMLRTGLGHIASGSSLKTIEAAIENMGRIEVYKLEKNISIIGTISGAAPMIGFFGTVIGMINAFIAISQEEGSVSPKLLSEGIYEAMITTAGGLAVGIVAYVAYNYLVRQVSDVVHHMEVTSIEFIDLLQRPPSN